jgi:hypothetical protein
VSEPDEFDEQKDEGQTPRPLNLTRPKASTTQPNWSLTAYNRKVLKSWDALCTSTPENACHCYDWLTQNAMRTKPRRCYQLKGKPNVDCWAYEIGSGDRVYYKVFESERKAVIYYAGRHPSQVPLPPKDL